MKIHLKDCLVVFLLTSSLLLTTVGIGMAAMGRSGGPDYYDYTFNDSNVVDGPIYKWDSISSHGTQILPNDNGYTNDIPIGFNFNFYGANHSKVSAAYNGIIFFNDSGNDNSAIVGSKIQWANENIGSSALHNFIAPYWAYLGTRSIGADAVYYQTIGTAPNRMFIVQWDNVYPTDLSSSSTNSTIPNNSTIPLNAKGITFEAILFEGSNDIIFQYKNVTFSPDDPMNEGGALDKGGEATVGIEGPAGQGLQYSFDEKVLYPNEAILFKYPQYIGTNLQLSIQAPGSKENGSSMAYTFYYINSGHTTFQNVTIVDLLSDNVTFDPASNDGNYDSANKTVTWDIGTVGPEECGYRTLNVSVPYEVPAGTVIPNNANITSDTNYDEAHVETVVIPSILPPYVGVEPKIDEFGTPLVSNIEPINFTYLSCNSATGVGINIHFDNGDDIVGQMENISGQPNKWIYTTVLSQRSGNATVTYTVYGCTQSIVSFNMYVDPSGYIYDVDTREPIANASVLLERWFKDPDGNSRWEIVPTNQSIMVPDMNPYDTAEDGVYRWDVIPGVYRVHVEALGYEPNNSDRVSIPPPVTDLHVGLVPIIVPPVASFISNVTSGIKPLTVSFNDTSTGKPTSWIWYFGDGTNSTEENPIHTYSKARQYNVTLIVKNSMGSSKVKEIGYITVLAPPVAAFSASPTRGKAPLTVNFTDKSKGMHNSLKWDFGDGNTSKDDPNPVYIYSIAGNYTVTLTAFNDAAGVNNTITKIDYIKVK